MDSKSIFSKLIKKIIRSIVGIVTEVVIIKRVIIPRVP